MIEKIVTGKMEKFYEENCLYEQHFIKDEGVTVKELVDQAIAKLGENIAIRRFSRFKVGEMDGSASSAADIRVAPGRAVSQPVILRSRLPAVFRCTPLPGCAKIRCPEKLPDVAGQPSGSDSGKS